MGHSKHSDFPQLIGALFGSIFKVIGYLAVILLRISGWLLLKISELIQKLTSHGH